MEFAVSQDHSIRFPAIGDKINTLYMQGSASEALGSGPIQLKSRINGRLLISIKIYKANCTNAIKWNESTVGYSSCSHQATNIASQFRVCDQ